MEVFEIHIAADDTIHEAAKYLNLKTIQVELLDMEGKGIRIEHMTSDIIKAKDLEECEYKVAKLASILLPCNVTRVKIESPWYNHYLDKTIYLETHFPQYVPEAKFPLSRNIGKDKLISTIRTYDKFELFRYYCLSGSLELEMCLYDTNPKQDSDWFSSWGITNDKS